MPFDFFTLAEQVQTVIADTEQQLRLEQAVYGLDVRDEREIQQLLASGFLQRKWYEVAREAPYPSTAGAKRTFRQRCDLVLTPLGRPLQLDYEPATLFDSPNFCPPQQALWLEVKIAYQFREGNIRHTGYGSQWRDAVVNDLRKMESDALIHEAGLLLIVFNENHAVLEKDLELFEDVLMRKEVLAGFRQVRSIPITERIGHTVCTAALWPTIQR
jgi:hypothetical protein